MLVVDDSTKKKAGRQIEGVAHYRNGAGSARQEYRTLRGLNFVWGIMRVPRARWPGHEVSIPIGFSLYLKEAQAKKLQRPYQSRSALAREIVDFVAAELPARSLRVLGDGGYATKAYLTALPPTVEVVSRMLITGRLYAPPPPRRQRRGRPATKGPLLGSPKTLARKRHGWQPHPTEAGTVVQAWEGLWQTVLPGRLLARGGGAPPGSAPAAHGRGAYAAAAGSRRSLTTDLGLCLEAILAQYRARWAVEITLRDSYAFDGVGQDQCRKADRIVGANTLRVVLAAARTLWFLEHTRHTGRLALRCSRPWYRQKVTPSQLDIVWTCREALHAAGVFPIPRFGRALAENPEEPAQPRPLAA